MAIVILLNNFLHDFSAAGWLFTTVVLWSILRKSDLDDTNRTAIADILKILLILMRVSLAGIVIFGLVRAIAYRDYEWNEAAGNSQVTLLIVKHIILTVIFIPGLIYYVKANRFIRRAFDEKTQ